MKNETCIRAGLLSAISVCFKHLTGPTVEIKQTKTLKQW